MGKKRSLSEVQRSQIVVLHDEGYPEREIGKRIGCSKTAVHQAIVKFKNSGIYNDAKRSGSPKKTTPRADNVIKRQVMKSPTVQPKRSGPN